MDAIPQNAVPAQDRARPRQSTERAAPRPVRTDSVGRPAPIQSPDRPWWFDAPKVFLGCAQIAFFPVTAVIRAAEVTVALAVLAVAGVAAGWWFGYVTDAEIITALQPVGQRILSMVQSAANR